eukprot:11977590-Alexandrium_andersonii.AAC.1
MTCAKSQEGNLRWSEAPGTGHLLGPEVANPRTLHEGYLGSAGVLGGGPAQTCQPSESTLAPPSWPSWEF